MNAKMEQASKKNSNPVLSVSKDGTIIYSNEAGEPILNEWGVKVGEKLPHCIVDLVQEVISRDNPEKMEVKVGNKAYLVVFHPLLKEQCVNISGFDITDCKQDEEKDRMKDDRFVKAQRLTKVGSWEWDIVKDDIVWSEQMYKMFGRSPELQPPRYGEYHSYFTPESWTRLDSVVKRALEFGEPYELELEHIRKDGSHGWQIARGESVIDNIGNVIKLWGAAQDITEHKRAEEALCESEIKFRQMAENIEEVFFSFTPDWKQTVYVSHAYERIWGRPLKEVYDNSMAWLEGVHPDDRRLPLAVVNKHISGNIMGTDTVEFRILRPNGGLKWILVRTYPVLDEKGSVCRITGIAEDITERKKAEEALKKAHDKLEGKVKERTAELEKAYNSLKESEKSLAKAQEMAHIGNWEWDIITNKAYWSEEMYRIFKRDPQKLAPSLKEYLSYIHPDDLDYYCNTTIATINTRKVGTSEVDFRIVLANGEERTLHLKSEYVFNDENIPVRVKGIVQDTTERKKVEDELEKIEIARKQEIHHRIKNNLQVISSLLDLQAEKFRGKKNIADSQVLEAFRESQDRIISMALIHEELHKGGELDKLNFSNYIEELAENLFLTYRVGNDNINLSIDLDCNVFLDMDTAVPLGIIINELVSNSLKYAFPDKNGGEIQIKLHRQENGECKREEGCKTIFILSVADNGIGIPEDFDIENPRNLGLQLVTTLVDQLDGELEMKRDNGTEFIIKFTVLEKCNQTPGQTAQLVE